MAEKSTHRMCTIPSSGYIQPLGLQAPVYKPIGLTDEQIKKTRALGFRVDIHEPETASKVEVETIKEVVEPVAPPVVTPPEEVVEDEVTPPVEEVAVVEEVVEDEVTEETAPVEETPVEEVVEPVVEEEVVEPVVEETTEETAPVEETPVEEEFLILEDDEVNALLAAPLRTYATELGEVIGYEFDLTKNKGLIADEVITQTAKWEAEQE